jgi:hypothetical protein
MNLKSSVEMSDNWFWGVFWFSTVCVVMLSACVLLFLRSSGVLPGKRTVGLSQKHFNFSDIADIV